MLRIIALAVLAGPSLFASVAGLAQENGRLTTTDDTRRVPLPPHDYSEDEIVALRGGTLIAGTGESPVEDALLVLQGDRILYAGASGDFRFPRPADRTIDTTGLYVLPGLIDLHVHFTSQRGDDAGRYRDSDAAAAIRGTLLLGQLLDAGITTVRDTGTRSDVAFKLKEAVERRFITGPRILWSGQRIVSRAGHGDEIVAVGSGRPKSMAVGDRERMATGPWDWRLGVREQIRRHADWIKLTSPYTREELTAAIDEAHMHGIPVAVDSYGKYSRWAAEAGIDSIEHPLALDEETVDIMAKNGVGLVPTLTTFHNLITEGYPSVGIPAGGFYYTMARRFPIDHERHLEIVKTARDAGVRIGVGTDIPIQAERRYPGSYYTELGLLADAGLSNEEVLAAATQDGAEILRMGDKLGTLEAGKLADVLVVGANPLERIDALQDVRMVVADGRVVRNRLDDGKPAAPDRQLPPVTAVAPNFYYDDLQEAKEWYVDKVGFRPLFVADWLVMVEVAPGMEIALVDGDQGSLKPVEDKGAMLTIETEQLEQWFKHVSSLEGIRWFEYNAGDATGSQPARGIRDHEMIEEFRVLDPGGYIIEFYRWKPEFRPSRGQ
jgi:imidazolonepropionase-like amidohydrolase